jgi:hypothetical protein
MKSRINDNTALSGSSSRTSWYSDADGVMLLRDIRMQLTYAESKEDSLKIALSSGRGSIHSRNCCGKYLFS